MPSSNRHDLQRFLDRLTSRSVLSQEEQQAILNLPSHAQQVRSNRDFVRLGDKTNHACLVVDGLVGRFEQTREGARQITAMHIAGDMPDLHSVVQPTATSALQALCTSTILRIPHVSIRASAARYPAVAEALWRDCMVDAAILSEWVVNVGRRNARTRVAHVFCEMATRYRLTAADGDIQFHFPITQTQLADVTGLTPVHVNRTMMSLRHDGVMTVHGSTVRIHDWNGLAMAGDFDPGYLQEDVRPEKRLSMAEAC